MVHDGPEYLAYAGMKTVLDNLIYRLEIPGLIVAFTHPEKRLVEYANYEPHARYLVEELVPFLEKTKNFDAATQRAVGRRMVVVAVITALVLFALGALLMRLNGLAFGEPIGPITPNRMSYLPMFAHFLLVLIAGIYLPAPIVTWFQNVAGMLG